ncbi:hypothetical protein NB614_09010 [Vibrio parahaemolyticus]|uniref:hypothetical protein n=1 Tax=Vibrio parahaemolyticus TaxID=670 RepID=UPI0006B280AE|nr:hypothetical protein [Vibrio parahaemolyticus]KOY32279.1 hypothetical protein ACX08_14795 [Vibrio parahaemolyticus]MCR9874773.1 hypothetical protein [Vibrio parahaemolyticus]
MQVFLISFTSPTFPAISREEILDFLDTQSIIKNWYAVLPNAILVVTDYGIPEITQIMTGRFSHNLTFLVTDASQANGLANQEVWDFVNNPHSSGRWQ